MRVVTRDGATIALGTTETSVTIGIIDHSRRVTDDFGVTTVVERGFSRRMSLRMAVPSADVDALQARLAALRATPAVWIADDRYASMTIDGIYREFEIDLAVPPMSFATLTIEGFGEPSPLPDAGADPAPDGQASTMQMLSPVAPTLVSSSVAEDDAPAWDAGIAYPAKARVRRGRRVYEAVGDVPAGDDPGATSGKWLDTGPLNRWAMFDEALGTETTGAGAVTVVLDAGDIDALALLDVTAAQVRVTAAGYDRTQAVGQGAGIFPDLPRGGGQVTVRITGPGTVRAGTLLIGRMIRLGVTGAAPSAGITDYSRKGVDEFGSPFLVKRAWAQRMALRALIRSDMVDLVAQRIAAVRARPTLWIGQSGTDALTVYGHYREFAIEVGGAVSTLSLAIDGMSGSAKLIPLEGGGPVDWADLTDRTGAKPTDNADRTADNVAKDTAAVGGRPVEAVLDALDYQALAADNADVAIEKAVADGVVQPYEAQSVLRKYRAMGEETATLANGAYRLARDPAALQAAYRAIAALFEVPDFGERDVPVAAAEWARLRDRWTAERDALRAAIGNVGAGLGAVPAGAFIGTGVALSGGAATGRGTLRTAKAYASPQVTARFTKGRVKAELIDATNSERYGLAFNRDGSVDLITASAPLVPYDNAKRPVVDIRLNLFDDGRTVNLMRDVAQSDTANGSVAGLPPNRAWVVEFTLMDADSAIEAVTLQATRPVDYLTSVVNGPPADATHGANVTPVTYTTSGAIAAPDAEGFYVAGTGAGRALIVYGLDGPVPWGGEPYLNIALNPVGSIGAGPATFTILWFGPGSIPDTVTIDARATPKTLAVPFGTTRWQVTLDTNLTSGQLRFKRPVLTPTAAAAAGVEIVQARVDDGIDGVASVIAYKDGQIVPGGPGGTVQPVDDPARVQLYPGWIAAIRAFNTYHPERTEEPLYGARYIAVSYRGGDTVNTGDGTLRFVVTAGGQQLGSWPIGFGQPAFSAILDVPSGVETYKIDVVGSVRVGPVVATIPTIRLRQVRSVDNGAVLADYAPVADNLADEPPEAYVDLRFATDPDRLKSHVEQVKGARLVGIDPDTTPSPNLTVATDIERNAAGTVVRISQTALYGTYRYTRWWTPGPVEQGQGLTALGWVGPDVTNRAPYARAGWARSANTATDGATIGGNLLLPGGQVAKSADVVTAQGIAAGFAGEAPTARSSDFAVVTGETRPEPYATRGAEVGYNLRYVNGEVIPRRDLITSEGEAARVKNQAATATNSDFDAVTGRNKPQPRADVTANALQYLADSQVRSVSQAIRFRSDAANAGPSPHYPDAPVEPAPRLEPRYFFYGRYEAGVDVSPSSDWSVQVTAGLAASINNDPGSLDRGVVTVSAFSAMTGFLSITSTFEGVSVRTIVRLEKNLVRPTTGFLVSRMQTAVGSGIAEEWIPLLSGPWHTNSEGSDTANASLQITAFTSGNSVSNEPVGIFAKLQHATGSDVLDLGRIGSVLRYPGPSGIEVATANLNLTRLFDGPNQALENGNVGGGGYRVVVRSEKRVAGLVCIAAMANFPNGARTYL